MKAVLRLELTITGRVQGVFYRHSARQAAERLGLAGSVRNLADGAVACIVEGEREAVEAFVLWARRGPPMARVDAVEVVELPPTGERGFRVLPSAD
jgi:acylphosphatase